ncbi:MAG TPA: pitrilysin family protein [Bryobacteraceae bacterium]|nr:pitrilysin family protein [Bryobacteraceae bacterium]
MMLRNPLLLLLAAAVVLGQDRPPKLKIQQHQFPNGLRMVMVEDHSRPVINLQVWYHVGSKDERQGRTGFAHLFEHMMFRGSKNVGPEEHMRYVRQAGGQVNAYTSFDMTVYWETFPSHYLERMLWLEADRMDSLNINEEIFKKEREVVKEERRLRIENPPYGLVQDDLWAIAYKEYPYKHTPIGSMEDLNAATAADVQEFFDTFYVPNNATVVIVGDFDAKQAIAWTAKNFGRIPRSRKPVPRVTATEPKQTEFREVTKRYNNIPLPAILNLYQLPPAGHADAYPLEIASAILSDGQSSRLYKRLVYDEQSAVAAAGSATFLEGPSLFFGFAVANMGKDIKEVGSSLNYALEQMTKASVEPDEITKAKNQITNRYIQGAQSMQQRADQLGRFAVLRGDANLYNTELDKYLRVTADDILKVCQRYLIPTNTTRLWVYPEADRAKEKKQ